MHELFRALNDMGCETAVERESETRRKQYRDAPGHSSVSATTQLTGC